MTTSKEKFKILLLKYFQFDKEDLSFGIYKILNYFRKKVKYFLDIELPQNIETMINQFKEKEGFINITEEDVIEVYNLMCEFFSLYPREIFTRSGYQVNNRENIINHKGEEFVFDLYKKDQFYIYLGDYLKNYSFKIKKEKEYRINFKIINSTKKEIKTKGETRYFFLPKNKIYNFSADIMELTIFFEFRSLSAKEKHFYKKNNSKQNLITKEIIKSLKNILEDNLRVILFKELASENITVIEKHLNNFFMKQTYEIFIQKNLKEFLSSKLENFLKTHLIDLSHKKEGYFTNLQKIYPKICIIRRISQKIIYFFDQIERIKRVLYQKIKFVTSTGYCITLDLIPKELYQKILDNKAQLAEWRKLYRFDKVNKGNIDYFLGDSNILDEDFLKFHQNLVLDTKFFDQNFKEKLIGSVENIDEKLNGLIIKSENFQAITLLMEKYQGKIKCIYNDPPYNTGDGNFIYKNEYSQNAWSTMVYNSIKASHNFLAINGGLFASIDDLEYNNLYMILNEIFGVRNYLGSLIVMIKPSGRTNDFFLASCHEYYLCYSNKTKQIKIRFFELTDDQKAQYRERDEIGHYKWRDFLRTGGFSTPEERPNSYYSIYFNEDNNKISLEKDDDATEIFPLDSKGRKRVWRKTQPSFLEDLKEGSIKVEKGIDNRYKVRIKDRIKEGTRPKSIWNHSKYDASTYGTKLLQNMFSTRRDFDYPKSINTIEDLIGLIANPEKDELILDIFAGSGTTAHAIINLNRSLINNGKLKYILVERDDHFDYILKPRIQKAVYSSEWKNGIPTSPVKTSHFFKYLYLEQFEDSLNNLETSKSEKGNSNNSSNHFLKYKINNENNNLDCKLNVELFSNPFEYKMKIMEFEEEKEASVDIIETFNYLLGIWVTKIKTLHKKSQKYKLIYGSLKNKKLIIIWRNTENLNLVDDKEFIEKNILQDFNADLIYINGKNKINNAIQIESMFFELMWR